MCLDFYIDLVPVKRDEDEDPEQDIAQGKGQRSGHRAGPGSEGPFIDPGIERLSFSRRTDSDPGQNLGHQSRGCEHGNGVRAQDQKRISPSLEAKEFHHQHEQPQDEQSGAR